MKDAKNITIALLLVSAALLGTVFVLVGDAEQAVAATSESRSADYLMIPGRVTSSRDIVYVIDMNTEQLNAYVVEKDWQDRNILLADGPVDLTRLVRQAESMRGGGRRRSGR